MICSKCGEICFAKADGVRSISNCCGAEVVFKLEVLPSLYHVNGYPKEYKSLRDEIAIAAMQGILANSEFEKYRQTLDCIVSEYE